MKEEIMDILCCPTCKSSLELHIDSKENDEILKGSLKCTNCKKAYPIKNGIPNFIDEEPM